MVGKRFNHPSVPEITKLDITPESVIPVEGSALGKTAKLRLTNLAFRVDIADAIKAHEANSGHPIASGQKNGLMSAADKLKLDTVQAGATENRSDSFLLNRANHTGELPWRVISEAPTTLSGYGITDAVPLVNGQIPTSYLPTQSLIDVRTVSSEAEMLALSGMGVGDRAYRTDLATNRLFTLVAPPSTNLANWQRDAIGIQSVNGQGGPLVVLGATDVGADPSGTANQVVASHAASQGNGSHIPIGGIVNLNVAENAAIAWAKISKTEANPGDIGAQPAGNYAPNPISNANVASGAGIDAAKIAVAATGDMTARNLQSTVSFLETRTRTTPWTNITATPTTLTGYGITDAVPLVNGQIPTSYLPTQSLIDVRTVNSEAEMLALTGMEPGDRAYRTDLATNRLFTLIAPPSTNLANWQRDAIGIQSVNGQGGPLVVLGATDVGADPSGTANQVVASHASSQGNGNHIPTSGIVNVNVAGNAAIAWAKISKTGATPADVGAQPAGNYAPNPISNANVASGAGIEAAKITVAATGDMTTRDLQSTISYLELRNRIHESLVLNGDFLVAQRGTSFTASGTGNTHTLDRWTVSLAGSAAFSATQNTTNLPATDAAGLYPGGSLQVATTTAQATYAATDWAGIYQAIEGILFRRIALSPFTVSFWVRSSKPGVYCLSARTTTQSHSYVAEYTINSANAWERKVLTFAAPPSGNWNYNTGVGLQLFWTLACGANNRTANPSNWISGSIIGSTSQANFSDTVGNAFALSLVKVEPGTTPTIFVPSLQSEFDCKRYYTREHLSYGAYSSAGEFYLYTPIFLGRPMRLTPSTKLIQAGTRSNVSNNNPVGVGMSSNRCGILQVSAAMMGLFSVNGDLWEFNSELN